MGHKNEKLSLIIDQNRLTALSQNGYVSHYWYDADGERTVKKHGGSMAVFVNSRQDGRE